MYIRQISEADYLSKRSDKKLPYIEVEQMRASPGFLNVLELWRKGDYDPQILSKHGIEAETRPKLPKDYLDLLGDSFTALELEPGTQSLEKEIIWAIEQDEWLESCPELGPGSDDSEASEPSPEDQVCPDILPKGEDKKEIS